MAKCKGCGKELTFWNSPAFGKDKGELCSSCAMKKANKESSCAMKKANKEFKQGMVKSGKELKEAAQGLKAASRATKEVSIKLKKELGMGKADERTFNKSFDSVYEATIQSLNNLGWKINNQSKTKIECTSKMGLFSFGQDVEITFNKTASGIKVGVISLAKGVDMLTVGGHIQQKRNVQKFFEEIEKRLLLMK